MKMRCFQQIGNGIVVAFAIILSFSLALTAIEELMNGETEMAIAFIFIILLLVTYSIKKIFVKKKNSEQQDGMKSKSIAVFSIFNIKKDIWQIKETGRKLEEKAPLITSTVKSVFVIAKWIVLFGVATGIIIWVFTIVFSMVGQRDEETKERESYQYTLPATIDGLRWSVKKIYDHGISIGRCETPGKFIEVVFVVENNGLAPLQSGTFNNFEVKDGTGRTYEKYDISLRSKFGVVQDVPPTHLSSENLSGYSSREIKPGIPYKFSEFFEVANDSNDFYAIVVVGYDFSGLFGTQKTSCL